jgi:hypothetical protein
VSVVLHMTGQYTWCIVKGGISKRSSVCGPQIFSLMIAHIKHAAMAAMQCQEGYPSSDTLFSSLSISSHLYILRLEHVFPWVSRTTERVTGRSWSPYSWKGLKNRRHVPSRWTSLEYKRNHVVPSLFCVICHYARCKMHSFLCDGRCHGVTGSSFIACLFTVLFMSTQIMISRISINPSSWQ